MRMGDVRATHDQSVEPVMFDLLESLVVAVDVALCLIATLYAIDRKRMHMKLNDRIGRPHETEKLPFGRFQSRIRHHVKEPDMHFPDVLVPSTFDRKDL